MRYIVVFTQEEIGYAVGFDTFADAVDFLGWGHEEYDLVPHGIFDAVTGEVFPYIQQGEPVTTVNKETICRTARAYLAAARRRTP